MALTHEEALSQLRDIRGMDVSFWQVLLEWLLYLSGALLLLLVCVYGSWRLWRAYQRRRLEAWREALKNELAMLEHTQMSGKQQILLMIEVLKKAAMQLYPREKVAGLHGEAWVVWLETYAEEVPKGFRWQDHQRLLVRLPYMPEEAEVPQQQIQDVFDATYHWVSHGQAKEKNA